MGRSGTRAPRCTACGTVWDAAEVRFCGRCGARLADALLVGPERAPATERRTAPPVTVAVGLLVVGLVVVAAGLAAGRGFDPTETPPTPPDTAVDLPGPDVLDDPGADDAETRSDRDAVDGEPAPATVPSVAPVGCDPPPCLRWQQDLRAGEVALLGDLAVHATAAPAPVDPDTGERRPHDHELTLSAIDVEDGTIVWQRRLPWPGADHPAPVDLLPVDQALLLVASPEEIHALDHHGERLWSQPSPDGRTLAARTAATGDLLVWTRGMTATATDAPVLRPDGAAVSAVAKRTRATGEIRWSRAYARLLAWTADHVLVREPVDGRSEVVAYDLDGSERWRRARSSDDERIVLGDGVVAVTNAPHTQVMDLATGDEVGRVEAHQVPGELVTFVGSALAFAFDVPDAGGVVTLVDPGTGRPLSQVAAVTNVAPAAVAPTGTTSPWEPSSHDLLVVLQQDPPLLQVRAYRSDGTLEWWHRRRLEHPDCCWELGAPGADGRIALLPPPHRPRDVDLLDLTDGTTVATIAMPATATDEHHRWVGGLLAIEFPRRTGPRTTFQGTHAAVSVAGPAELLTLTPVPVLVTPVGLLGLEPEVFLAS